MAEGNAGQIQEFVAVLKRRRWQIALPALFVLVFGAAFAVIVPKKYLVDTRIMLRETRNPFDSLQRTRGESTTSQETENVPEHILNYGMIEQIVSKHLIDLWPEYSRADASTRHDIIDAIMKNIAVERVQKNKEVGSTFFDISYKDVDDKRAVAFLQKLNTAWIERLIERDLEDLEIERDVLAEVLVSATKEFRDAADKHLELATLMRVNPSQPPDARDRYGNSPSNVDHELLADYRRQQEQNETDLAMARKALEELQANYRLEPDTVLVPQVMEGERYQAEIIKLEAQIDAVREKLAQITSLHGSYETLKQRVEQLQEKVAEYQRRETEDAEVLRPERNERKDLLRTQVSEAALQVAGLEAERTRLAEKVEEYQQRVDRSAEEYSLLSTLYHAKERAMKDRNLAAEELAKKESAIRLFRETSSRVYEVVKRPVASDSAREPSAALLIAFALFAGLSLGLGIALLSEYGRNSYRTVSDLSAVMTVPVLGAVGSIVTGVQRRKAAARRMVVGVSSAVILLGVGWMTYLYAFDEDQLPVAVLQAIEDFRLMLM